MSRKIGVFLIIAFLAASLIVHPGEASYASEYDAGGPDGGFDTPFSAMEEEPGDGLTDGEENEPPEGGIEQDTGTVPMSEGDEILPEEDEAGAELSALEALEAIEELTVEPNPGVEYNGYIVTVRPEEVTSEMIEAAPGELVADAYFVVEEPEEALDFAEPDQIEIIEPNYVMKAMEFPYSDPNDANFANQWYLSGSSGSYEIGARDMWASGMNGAGVRVAVFDTGIRASHRDFGLITQGYNFTNGTGSLVDNDVSDGKGHGTMVSSMIAAQANNNYNIAGLAYAAEIVPYKVLDNNGDGDLIDVIAALNHLAGLNSTLKVGVVNMSLGAPLGSPNAALQQSIDKLVAQGVIVIAAAGNGASLSGGGTSYTALMYPAACAGVIGVAAVDSAGLQAGFSQRNSSVDVAAPGVDIYGLYFGNDTSTSSGNGTSYAAPLVAAVAAGVKQADPSAGYAAFLALLEKTSTRMPKGTTVKNVDYGFGLLNAGEIAKECGKSYMVRYLYDGIPDIGLTDTLPINIDKSGAPAPGTALNEKEGYKFYGYYLNGRSLTATDFPVEIKADETIDVCYVSMGLSYEDGHWYYNAYGIDEGEPGFGWVEYDDGYRFFDLSGRMATGLVNVPGLPGEDDSDQMRKCFFDTSDGFVVTGLVRIGNYNYYFGGVDGMAVSDKFPIDKATKIRADLDVHDPPNTAIYSFDVNGRGITGWFPEAEGQKYYDGEGRAEGAKKIGGYFYYFDPAREGALRTAIGMIEDGLSGNYYYCYNAKGYLRAGKFTVAKVTYYADKKTAALINGQIKDGSYFFWYEGPLGLRKNVEREVGSQIWWYGSNGRRVTGWVTFSTDALAAGTKGPGMTEPRHQKGDRVYYDKKQGLLTGGAYKIGSYRYFLIPWRNGALWTKVGDVVDDRDPDNIIPYYYYCYSTKGYLRAGGEQAIKDAFGNTIKLYYDKSGLLAQGAHKVGSYFFYYINGIRQIPVKDGWIEDAAGNWFYTTAPQGRLKTGKFTAPESDVIGAPAQGALLYMNPTTASVYKGRVKLSSRHFYYDGKLGLVLNEGWVYSDGGVKKYYVTATAGRLKTGELKLAAYPGGPVTSYYFAPGNAELLTGQVKIGSHFYYYEGEDGRVLGDERTVVVKGIGRIHYYREGDGRRVTGWVTHAGVAQKGVTVTNVVPTDRVAGEKVYYHSANGLLRGKNKIGSYWYWFDGDSGSLWTKVGTKEEPFIVDTNPVTGIASYYYCYSAKGYLRANAWVRDLVVRDKYGKERKNTYYFNKNGVRLDGVQKIGSYRFFFDRQTGALVKTNGYYLDRATGMIRQYDGKTPIWILDGGDKYCTSRTDGRLMTGVQTIGGKQYFFESNGKLCVNGEKKVSGKWYFFDENGERLMDAWLSLPDGRQVYFGPNGVRYSGVKKIAVKNTDGGVFRDENNKTYEYWYYFNTGTGAKTTGFIKISGKEYFYDPVRPTAADVGQGLNGTVPVVIPGARAYGETLAGGVQVYLDPVTGVLFTGMKLLEGNYYYYDGKKGKLLGAEKKVGSYTYYFRAANEVAGYSFESNGITLRTGFLKDPVPGPPGSRVKGWWQRPQNADGDDMKFYSNAPGTEGRMLVGRQSLPVYYTATYDVGNKAFYFLSGSTGLVRKNAAGVYNGFAWITNEWGEVLSWMNIGNTLKGIDVSYWQKDNINWQQVRASGVRVAIARAGYNNHSKNPSAFFPDSTFKRNVVEARKNGVYVGAYIYIYSCRTADLNAGIDGFAAWMKQQGLGPGSLDLPVFLDMEDKNSLETTSGKDNLTNVIRAGMNRLKSHGYTPGFYSNMNWANNYYHARQLEKEGFTFWLAAYGNNQTEHNPATIATPGWFGSYPGIWQYRSTGKVPGISGNVDMNYIYSGRVKWT